MQVEEYLERKTREERTGPAIETIPDADLFYEDVQPEQSEKVEKVSRKESNRKRVTRARAIIEAANASRPVLAQSFGRKKANNAKIAESLSRDERPEMLDSMKVEKEGEYDLWQASKDKVMVNRRSMKAMQKWKKDVGKIRAVEVDAPGSSINPDRELHQEVVAEAVAVEMKKQYDRELLPVAPPRIVEWDDDYQKDELEKLLAEPASDGSSESDEDEDEAQATKIQRRKTLKDRNRQLRHKKIEGEIARKKKEKKKLQDLEIVQKISKDVEETLTEREERIQRRQVDREEMERTLPPRLGRHEFKPLPIQVMTTDELEETGGSLRKLKPTPVLAKERYKSLQKRGIIEPRVKVNKRRGKRKIVIHGKRADNAEERQNEIREMQQKNKRRK